MCFLLDALIVSLSFMDPERKRFKQTSLLSMFATLAVSIATAERTFSVLKYLKSYLRSSTGEERLTGLALAYIHRVTDVHKTVELMVELFATKQLKITS